MKNSLFSLILLVGTLFAVGCQHPDDPVTSSSNSSALYGRVVDAGGNPVEGVEIHYIYSLTPMPLAKIQKPCPATVISFTVPAPGHVSVFVLRWYTRDTVAVLMRDSVLQSGTYSVPLNAVLPTNGVYVYSITAGGKTFETKMLMLQTDVNDLIKSLPLCRTDASGEFAIPYGVFGFGIPFPLTDGAGTILQLQYVSTTIQLVAFKARYPVLTQTVTLDTTRDMRRTFSFQ